MKIENAIDLTRQLAHKVVLTEVNLAELEEKFIAAGLDKYCFCIFKVTFSDGPVQIWFDYPTDMDDEQALAFSQQVLEPLYK